MLKNANDINLIRGMLKDILAILGNNTSNDTSIQSVAHYTQLALNSLDIYDRRGQK